MRLKLKTLYVTANRHVEPGEVAEFDEKEGKELLGGGHATKARGRPPKTSEPTGPEVETAEAAPEAERAETRPKRKRTRAPVQ